MTRAEVERMATLADVAWTALLKYATFLTPKTRALAVEFRGLVLKAIDELRETVREK